MGRRKSVFDELLDLLFDLTGDFWQVGAVVTLVFGIFSLAALKWAVGKAAAAKLAGGTTLAVFQNLSWAFYLVPLVLALFALAFGWKTYAVYTKKSSF